MLREKENKSVSKMISSVEMLAEANSERGALSSQLLPALHWVLLTALSGLILVAFLLYDSDFSGTVEENRIIFAVLAAAFLSVLRVWPRCPCCHDSIVLFDIIVAADTCYYCYSGAAVQDGGSVFVCIHAIVLQYGDKRRVKMPVSQTYPHVSQLLHSALVCARLS